MDGTVDPGALASVLRALADTVEKRLQPNAPAYYDSANNPFGSARVFRRLCRIGAFPSFQPPRTRRILARVADVDAYVSKHPVRAGAEKPSIASTDPLDCLRAELGLLTRGVA